MLNYLAAFAATEGLVRTRSAAAVPWSFGGVEHRLEHVRVLRGITFINDSIGTSPTRTSAGLHAMKRKPIVIAGGYDKHIPFDGLGEALVPDGQDRGPHRRHRREDPPPSRPRLL